MRDITDERNNIAELQRYLRELHHDSDYDIPLVNPDGIYGDETRLAVEAFQQAAGLPVTGAVDYNTWTAIYAAYTKSAAKRARPEALFPFPEEEGYIITEGEYSDIVAIVQFVLRMLAGVYDDIDGLAPEGVYGDATMKDIRTFQQIHRLPVTGNVDKATWNELANAYNRAVNIKN